MADAFANAGPNLDSPAFNAAAVTPHNTNALANVSRALYVGSGGDVAVTMKGGGDVTFVAVPDGAVLPISVTHVKVTGTTATDMVALW